MVKRKLNSLKIKAFGIAIFVFLVSSVYAVPFEAAQSLEEGQGELMLGYSSMLNLTFKGSFGIADCPNLGFGIDMPFINIYLSGKHKLFSFGVDPGFDFLLSGAYGITDTDTPYCHCTLLAGLNYKEGECFTFGVGIIRDPRLTFNPFALGNSNYSRKLNYHILLGLNDDRFIKQVQFILDPSDKQDKIKIIFGLGFRRIQFLE